MQPSEIVRGSAVLCGVEFSSPHFHFASSEMVGVVAGTSASLPILGAETLVLNQRELSTQPGPPQRFPGLGTVLVKKK